MWFHHQKERTIILAGVSQGSVLLRILFTAYVSPISHLIDSFDITYRKYMDNTQLYMALSTLSVSGLDHLAKCTDALQV